MTALPEYISTARKIQAEVGESRPEFVKIFEKIYTCNQCQGFSGLKIGKK